MPGRSGYDLRRRSRFRTQCLRQRLRRSETNRFGAAGTGRTAQGPGKSRLPIIRNKSRPATRGKIILSAHRANGRRSSLRTARVLRAFRKCRRAQQALTGATTACCNPYDDGGCRESKAVPLPVSHLVAIVRLNHPSGILAADLPGFRPVLVDPLL